VDSQAEILPRFGPFRAQQRSASSAPRQARAVRLLRAWLYIAVACLSARAQAPAASKIVWYSYNGDHLFAKRWELHFDGSYRSTLHTATRQWLVRPGIQFKTTDRIKLSAAYAYFDLRPNGLARDEEHISEHRLHQQIEYSMPWHRTILRQRLRVEERLLSTPWHEGHPTQWQWRDRTRYCLRWDIPLGKPGNGSAAPVLTVYDELMLSFASPAASAFQQNRIYSGLTWKLTPHFAVETGAMRQQLKTTAGPLRHNWIFLVTLRNNLPLRSLFSRFRGS